VSAPKDDDTHPRKIVLNAFMRRGGEVIATLGYRQNPLRRLSEAGRIRRCRAGSVLQHGGAIRLNLSALTKLFDSYNRVARLYPALLAIAPILCSAIVVFPSIVSNIPRSTAVVFGMSCLAYFLASLARSRGKKIEEQLLAKWGGWPTTVMLRHRDDRIDRVTKARYHTALAALCPDITMPSAIDEQNAPSVADDTYRSATKRLIEMRRGPEYQMLHRENASYGFRRNMLGLKPAALGVAGIASLVTVLGWWTVVSPNLTWPSVQASIVTYPYLPVLLAFDAGYFLLWATMINESFVLQAAREYTEALFRTLDSLPNPRKPRTSAKKGS
jgi:hypothetical protein